MINQVIVAAVLTTYLLSFCLCGKGRFNSAATRKKIEGAVIQNRSSSNCELSWIILEEWK